MMHAFLSAHCTPLILPPRQRSGTPGTFICLEVLPPAPRAIKHLVGSPISVAHTNQPIRAPIFEPRCTSSCSVPDILHGFSVRARVMTAVQNESKRNPANASATRIRNTSAFLGTMNQLLSIVMILFRCDTYRPILLAWSVVYARDVLRNFH